LILGGVLTSVFVPLFVEWLTKRGAAAAWEAARSMLTVVLIVLTSMMVIAIVAAPWIVDVYIRAPGPQADAERRLATFFLRWFLPQSVFYGAGAPATGLLNSHRRYSAPMFGPILTNLIVISTFVIFPLLPGA